MSKKIFKIKEKIIMDEERILEALERSRKEESYHHTEVWKMLGIGSPEENILEGKN